MAPTPAAARRLRIRANLHLVDYAILALAFTSLLVFILDRTHTSLPGDEEAILRGVDLTLVGLYALAFGFKWLFADRPMRWLARNAINALGVLPLTINVLSFVVADRYFVIVQVIVVILRTGEALDRAFGERVLHGLFERYRYMLVEELTDPLLMRLAIVLEDAVTSRDYAAALGRSLEQRRPLVKAALDRAIAASPKLQRVTQFGPVERWVDETREEMVDALHAALTSPEINEIIRAGLQDAFSELKAGIAARKWHEKGVGVKDIAQGVVRGGAD